MNVERIVQLANRIEAQPHTPADADSGFNMAYYHHDCGTPSCIAGWAACLFTKDRGEENKSTFELAAEALDLDEDQAGELFYGSPYKPLAETTPQEAADCLRRLAETGQVEWAQKA